MIFVCPMVFWLLYGHHPVVRNKSGSILMMNSWVNCHTLGRISSFIFHIFHMFSMNHMEWFNAGQISCSWKSVYYFAWLVVIFMRNANNAKHRPYYVQNRKQKHRTVVIFTNSLKFQELFIVFYCFQWVPFTWRLGVDCSESVLDEQFRFRSTELVFNLNFLLLNPWT